MDAWLDKTLVSIADEKLLPPACFQKLDCDHALDVRDRNLDFESRWLELHEIVESRWPAGVPESVKALVEKVRSQAFLAVSRATQQHEIASYVSDDFDLIARGKVLGLSNGLLDDLWAIYQRGEFPVPPLNVVPRTEEHP